MKKATSYLRFSSNNQQHGDSKRRQMELGQRLADKMGWVIDDGLTLQDLGVSAFKGKNAKQGALKSFLDLIQAGRVERGHVLIVESIDRLSRDEVGEALQLFLSILNAGVEIATTTPERHYTKKSINDLVGIVEPLLYMCRAHEESAMKSKRLQEAWKNKRNNIATRPLLGGQYPAWLKLSQDRKSFDTIPDRVKTIRKIVQMKLDGHRTITIAKTLNDTNVPIFQANKRCRFWTSTYIHKILTSRALIGEFQPRSGLVPVGQPIADYFPRVLDDKTFYRLQSTATSKAGRTTESIVNLFHGLLYSSAGETMSIKCRKPQPSVFYPYGVIHGVPKLNGVCFPVSVMEQAFLKFLPEVKPEDINNQQPLDHDTTAEQQDKLADIENRISTLHKQIELHPELTDLYEVLATLQSQRDETRNTLEQLIALKHQVSATATLKDLTTLCKNDTQAPDIRRRLKDRIKRLVSRIELDVEQKNRTTKLAVVSVSFTSGNVRKYAIVSRGKSYWLKVLDSDFVPAMVDTSWGMEFQA